MIYNSTRDKNVTADGLQAVLEGIAPDGGLYIPSDITEGRFDWQECLQKDFTGMAEMILRHFFPEYGGALGSMVEKAYGGKFDSPDITPLVTVGDDYCLELFRGPTSAFKDIALSMLPELITNARAIKGIEGDLTILTATSGDTGKAALEGFKDIEGTKILVFYPEEGVSRVQKAQMQSQEGSNVRVCAVKGNFDDCQKGVKEAFAQLKSMPGLELSSANSINIGRLIPQITYYFSAYSQLLKLCRIQIGERADFVVPTGNFGDILAGYLAKLLGLPVGKLIIASNANDVLTDFIYTGIYDTNREFHKTASPSMDILVSSNLERLLYLGSDGDTEFVSSCMEKLADKGSYDIRKIKRGRVLDLKADFSAYSCDDKETAFVINRIWKENRYLCDPHTAVAFAAAEAYKEERGISTDPVVVLSTASPFKFPEFVLKALGKEDISRDPLRELSNITGIKIPQNLKGILNRVPRFRDTTESDGISDYVLKFALPGLYETKKESIKEKVRNTAVVSSVSVPKKKGIARVPASSANLGPGFDTFGIAWQIYDEIEFVPGAKELRITGTDERYCNENNLAFKAYSETLKYAGRKTEPVEINFLKTEIPICRGLGSSSALIVAGVGAANGLHDLGLSKMQMLEIAARVEGHPDNVAPALFGGLTCSMMEGKKPLTAFYNVDTSWQFTLLIPDFELSTAKARKALPKEIPLKDGVFNVSHAVLTLKALETGNRELLKASMQDRFHQNFRIPLIPGYEELREAALKCGADAFCISGAGPTLLCISKDPDMDKKLKNEIGNNYPGWEIKQVLPALAK